LLTVKKKCVVIKLFHTKINRLFLVEIPFFPKQKQKQIVKN
jgi:hypothetical protein